MTLKPLAIEDMPVILYWRNQVAHILRTSFPLTLEQQMDWYKNEVCSRHSKTRFFGIWQDFVDHTPIDSVVNSRLIGYGGIENIQWENGIGEISLLIDPALHGNGYGTKAAEKILDYAFNNMGLATVWGEAYKNNKAWPFWEKLTKRRTGYLTTLPNRKYHSGQYFDSLYFSISP